MKNGQASKVRKDGSFLKGVAAAVIGLSLFLLSCGLTPKVIIPDIPLEPIEQVRGNAPDCTRYYETLESGEYTESDVQDALYCEQNYGLYYQDLYEILRSQINVLNGGNQ